MKLSICISTRNRAHSIGETLESLITDLPDGVEVLVLDGASTDDTPDVVAKYAQRHPALRYVRLEKNGGVDLDYHRTVERAKGEFCWLMTDDDVVVPGGVRRVSARLADDVDLVIVNAQVRTEDLSRVLEPRRLTLTEDCSFAPDEFERFFESCARYMSFIGSVVIRRSTWLDRNEKPYLGTEFIHCGMIFQRSLQRRIEVIAEPVIYIRYGVAQWSARAFDIWMFKWPRLIWSFGAFSDEAKRKVVARQPWHDPRELLFFRARGLYTREIYAKVLAHQESPPGLRLLARTIAGIPDQIACNGFALAAALRRPHDKMLQVDLRGNPHYWTAVAPLVDGLSALVGRMVKARSAAAR